MARELESFLLPADRTSRFGVEGKSIAIIDIASSSKMEHNYITGRGGHLQQEILPSIILTLVMAMML